MNPYIIDTHAHVNFNAYKEDHDEVIRRCLDKNILIINVGSQIDSSKRAVEMADKYETGVYAAIGLHPIHLVQTEVDEEEINFKSREEKFDEQKYQAIIDSHVETEHAPSKIVAIGEIGLDYYHILTGMSLEQIKKFQQPEFVKQLQFANKNNLPVILHCRGSEHSPEDAYHDLLNILKKQRTKIKGVIHCFTSTTDIANAFINLGLYIGFTGIITFGKNADLVRDVVKNIPLEKILVETDCPYLAPDPHRGERNEPAYVEYVARKIAEIKHKDLGEVFITLVDNSRKLFNI